MPPTSPSRLKIWTDHLEMLLVGILPSTVQHNMRIELGATLVYGMFYAAGISFIPVVLRRMGATENMLAIYVASQFLGSVLASLSVMLMRRRRTMNVILTSWYLARASFLLWALIVNPIWMLVLGAFFWTLEPFTGPGYTRILQLIYPTQVRGKVMSIVRMGRGLITLLLVPLAGWALDHWGYRTLFPLAASMGVFSTWIFSHIKADEGPLSPRQTKAIPELFEIVRVDRRFSFFLGTFTLFGIGTLLSWTIYPLVQVDKLHLSYSALGWLEMVSSLFWLVGYFAMGRLVDKHGGVYVLRISTAVAILIPTTYIFASNGWMLIPAFAAQGFINAGWELGPINALLQLADPKRVTEYAAIQSTAIGLRGIIIPLVSVGLLHSGVSFSGVFLISIGFMCLAWWMFGKVEAKNER